jgi:hypothetical protein
MSLPALMSESFLHQILTLAMDLFPEGKSNRQRAWTACPDFGLPFYICRITRKPGMKYLPEIDGVSAMDIQEKIALDNARFVY